jgi:hypothetical protein
VRPRPGQASESGRRRGSRRRGCIQGRRLPGDSENKSDGDRALPGCGLRAARLRWGVPRSAGRARAAVMD